MQIDKQEILDLLREKGDHEKASQAEQELPERVDHDEHQDVLERLGVNPQELLGRLRKF